jgi:uncharacterized protein YbjT (DUF2867 family)
MSGRKTVLVTGATGNVGRQVVEQLRAVGYCVRAVTRNPETAGFSSDVDVVRGDLARPETLADAVRNVDRAFLLWPFLAASAGDVPAVLDLFDEQLRRVVVLSSRGVRDDIHTQRDPNSQFHADIENLIEKSGRDWTFLRAGGFASNTLGWAEQIRHTGTVRAPFGAMSRPLIHEADIAAVAVRALTTDGHAGAKYDITGPRALSQVEQARAIGAAIGRLVRWIEISPDEARPELLAQGWSEPLADGALQAWAEMVAVPERPTNTVRDVTGRTGRTFAEWAADHAADFR